MGDRHQATFRVTNMDFLYLAVRFVFFDVISLSIQTDLFVEHGSMFLIFIGYFKVFEPQGEERLALATFHQNEFRLIFVIDWNPLDGLFHFQYLSHLATTFALAKLDFRTKNDPTYIQKTTRKTTCNCNMTVCHCQGSNLKTCGRTVSVGKF